MTTERQSMGGEYETVVTQVTVKPSGKTIFDLGVSHVKIDDEGGGMFVVVRQESDASRREIQIDPLEWEPLKAAIDRMVCEIIAMELADDPLNRKCNAEDATPRTGEGR